MVKVWDVQTVLQATPQCPGFSTGTHQPEPSVECRLQPGRSAPGLRGRSDSREKGEVKVWDLNTRHEASP